MMRRPAMQNELLVVSRLNKALWLVVSMAVIQVASCAYNMQVLEVGPFAKEDQEVNLVELADAECSFLENPSSADAICVASWWVPVDIDDQEEVLYTPSGEEDNWDVWVFVGMPLAPILLIWLWLTLRNAKRAATQSA